MPRHQRQVELGLTVQLVQPSPSCSKPVKQCVSKEKIIVSATFVKSNTQGCPLVSTTHTPYLEM